MQGVCDAIAEWFNCSLTAKAWSSAQGNKHNNNSKLDTVYCFSAQVVEFEPLDVVKCAISMNWQVPS